MRMGVVADDLTGANDIGIMFAKSGYVTDVYTFERTGDLHQMPDKPDILILDTNSRLDSPPLAYEKVFAATRELQGVGCQQFFNKTSSAFVGNVGAYFDAMLDALSENFAVVVVGFPKNGRTTIRGIHYVHGKKLEESEFRHDPVHPMTRSSLVEILQSQTTRRVGLIEHEVIAGGAAVLRARLDVMRAECNYVVLDVIDQQALVTIAHTVRDEKVLCGSSALAEELPGVWGLDRSDLPLPSPSTDAKRTLSEAEVLALRVSDLLRRGVGVVLPSDDLGVLCAAASLMPQTVAQIQHLREKGAAVFELDSLALFEETERESEVGRLSREIAARLRDGQNVVLHSPNQPERVERTRVEGARRGLSRTEVSRRVSDTIAETVARTRDRSGLSRLIVAGGETSAAVCARLGVKGMRILKEIQPGLPSCLSLGSPPLLLVLKSGSFGSPDFFEQAIAHLNTMTPPEVD